MDRKFSWSISHLSLFAPACLIISILYDAAYFRVFGLSLSEIPSTINSYLKSAIDMFVLMLVLFIAFTFVRAFDSNIPKPSYGVVDGVLFRDKLKRFFDDNFLELGVLGFCFVVLYFAEGLTIFYVWMIIIISLICILIGLSAKNLFNILGDYNALVFIFGVFSLVFIIGLAVNDALVVKLDNVVGDGDVSISDCNRCKLMRSYDDYFIFWDIKEQSVKMISKDNIKVLMVSTE